MSKTIRIINLLILCLFVSSTTSHADIWDNCVGKWKLASTTYTDTSGSGNNLTGYNTPTAAAGHYGGSNLSTSFASASAQYCSIADNASLSITGSMSISAWVYMANVNTYKMIVTKFGASGNYSFSTFVHAAGNIVIFNASNNGTELTTAQTSTGLSAGVWYHLCFVYNGTDMRIYINGALATNGSSNPKAYTSGIYNGTAAFRIGATDQVSPFYMNGRVDDVAIWNRALSASEVVQLYYMFDDFLETYEITGTLRDTAGTAIDCSTYNVRVNAYDINNATGAPVYSLLNTAADGTFTLYVPDQDPYLVTYEYYGSYTPTSQSNIAGAEIMVGE